MALENSIAALAAIKANLKAVLTGKLGTSPGDHFADYAGLIAANWPESIVNDYDTTQFLVHLNGTEITLHFSQTDADSVHIEWGDGEEEDVAAVGEHTVTHEYAVTGNYKISMTVSAGTVTLMSNAVKEGNYLDTVQAVYFGIRVVPGDQCFTAKNSITEIWFSQSNINIGLQAFCACSIARFSGTSSLNGTMAESAFDKCKLLDSVKIGGGEIGDHAFLDCLSLVIVNVQNGVTKLLSRAFAGCMSLTQIDLPDTITHINSYAFEKCYSLATLKVRATTPPAIYANAFPPNLTSIKVPSAAVADYKAASNWSAYESIITAL